MKSGLPVTGFTAQPAIDAASRTSANIFLLMAHTLLPDRRRIKSRSYVREKENGYVLENPSGDLKMGTRGLF